MYLWNKPMIEWKAFEVAFPEDHPRLCDALLMYGVLIADRGVCEMAVEFGATSFEVMGNYGRALWSGVVTLNVWWWHYEQFITLAHDLARSRDYKREKLRTRQ